jgi:hypothetical protein
MNDSTRVTRKEQARRNQHRRKAGKAAHSLARAQQAADSAGAEQARTRLLRHQLGAEGQPLK